MKTPLRSSRLIALLLCGAMAACGDSRSASDTGSESGAAVADAITSNGVKADLALQSDWGSGYCANVTLTNTSSAAVTSWTLVFELNGSTLSQLWNGASTQSGTQVTVKGLSWNSNIAPSASVSFGFCGGGAGRPSLASLVVTGGSTTTTSYSLAIATTGNGSTSPATGTYTYPAGTAVKVTATASSGYVFSGWSGAASGTTNPVTITMDGNKSLTATFIPGGTSTYSLSISASGSGTTSPAPGAYSYPAGTSVTVTATPASGATFTGWTGAATGTTNPLTIAMDANKTLTATFSGGSTCQKGTTRGSEVAVIGESFIAMSHGITQEIEKQAKAAGSLAQNDHYVDNSVSGTTLANNQIPSQYTKAVQSSGTIRYVLMDGGGNDCLLNNNGDAAYAAAQSLFQTMAQNRTEKVVYFFYPDPVGSNFASLKSCLDALRPRMKSLCDGLTAPKCYWLDLRSLWNGHPEYTSDGIHPTTAGSTVTGDAIWSVMKTNCVAQ